VRPIPKLRDKRRGTPLRKRKNHEPKRTKKVGAREQGGNPTASPGRGNWRLDGQGGIWQQGVKLWREFGGLYKPDRRRNNKQKKGRKPLRNSAMKTRGGNSQGLERIGTRELTSRGELKDGGGLHIHSDQVGKETTWAHFLLKKIRKREFPSFLETRT